MCCARVPAVCCSDLALFAAKPYKIAPKPFKIAPKPSGNAAVILRDANHLSPNCVFVVFMGCYPPPSPLSPPPCVFLTTSCLMYCTALCTVLPYVLYCLMYCTAKPYKMSLDATLPPPFLTTSCLMYCAGVLLCLLQ
jgi:hypothetical protein